MASNDINEISFPNKKRKIDNFSVGNEIENVDNKREVQPVSKKKYVEEANELQDNKQKSNATLEVEIYSDNQFHQMMDSVETVSSTQYTENVQLQLPEMKNLTDVCEKLKTAQNIIVISGAGVSVSSGIPDFRSRDGIYQRLIKDYPDVPEPQSMFDIQYFSKDPRPFYKFAREIYPGKFKPSPCHFFIKKLEEKKKLLRNYTQNIDTLEKVVGINNLIECHGSFATASCTRCGLKVSGVTIRQDINEQKIPICKICNPGIESPKAYEVTDLIGINWVEDKSANIVAVSSSDEEDDEDDVSDVNDIRAFGLENLMDLDIKPCRLVQMGIMKPDIVFFGEGLPEEFHEAIDSDREKCDLLIVIGSSMLVRPVATIPDWIQEGVPKVLINRETLPVVYDMNLLGDADIIVNQICHMMGSEWDDICFRKEALEEATALNLGPYRAPDEFNIGSASSNTTTENHDNLLSLVAQGRKIVSESTRNMYIQMSTDSGFDSSSSEPNHSQGSITKLPQTSPATSISSTISCKCSNSSINSNCVDISCENNLSVEPKHTSNSVWNSNENYNIQYFELSDNEINDNKEPIVQNANISNIEETPVFDSKDYFGVDHIEPKCNEVDIMAVPRDPGYVSEKESISALLPSGTYYRIFKRHFIFPGAEVFIWPKDNEISESDISNSSISSCSSNSNSSSSSTSSTYSSSSSTSLLSSASNSCSSSSLENSSVSELQIPEDMITPASKVDAEVNSNKLLSVSASSFLSPTETSTSTINIKDVLSHKNRKLT